MSGRQEPAILAAADEILAFQLKGAPLYGPRAVIMQKLESLRWQSAPAAQRPAVRKPLVSISMNKDEKCEIPTLEKVSGNA